MKKLIYCAVALSLSAAPFTAQAAEADLKKGEKVFKKCKVCHEVAKEKNKIGPHLVNIFGREAGSIEGYKYSSAMKAKGAEGLVWDAETLDTYLKKPRDFVPKTKMAFPAAMATCCFPLYASSSFPGLNWGSFSLLRSGGCRSHLYGLRLLCHIARYTNGPNMKCYSTSRFYLTP